MYDFAAIKAGRTRNRLLELTVNCKQPFFFISRAPPSTPFPTASLLAGLRRTVAEFCTQPTVTRLKMRENCNVRGKKALMAPEVRGHCGLFRSV